MKGIEMDDISEAKEQIRLAVDGAIPIRYIKTNQEFAYYTFGVGDFTILTFNDAEFSDWIMEVRIGGKVIFQYDHQAIVGEQLEDDFCEMADNVRRST